MKPAPLMVIGGQDPVPRTEKTEGCAGDFDWERLLVKAYGESQTRDMTFDTDDRIQLVSNR